MAIAPSGSSVADWGFTTAVVDTNVVWAAFSRRPDGDRTRCRQILRSGVDGDVDLYVSTLTFVEVFKVPDDEVSIDDVAVLSNALERPGWTPVDLDGHIAILARELALEYGIKNAYDCAILATAVDVGAEVLITSDRRDFEIGKSYRDVLVIEPPEPRDPPLDFPD
jgi:predicted nucleic acid-binding protein